MSGTKTNNETTETSVLRAARRILRPLIRILLRHGVSAPRFQELARKTFVDVAFDEFALDGKSQSQARVSIITGLNRKEVARLRNLSDEEDQDREWWNRAGTVLAAWNSDSRFHTRAGYPLDLPFAGNEPNFTQLVKLYSGDMYPRALADELLRLGAIEVVDQKYRLTNRGYVPANDAKAMLDILGVDTAELVETIDHNLQVSAEDKLFQAKVLANNLPAEHLDAFNEFSRQVSHRAVEELVQWLNEHDAGKDAGGEDARFEVGLGLFQINRQVREGRPPETSPDGDNGE